jgi:hypothetical protein
LRPSGTSSTPGCCENTSKPSRARRSLDAAGYVVPSAILVLLPKCPACIAAYLAMGAGIGVTLSTAATLRAVLLVLSVACLAVVAARHLRRKAG